MKNSLVDSFLANAKQHSGKRCVCCGDLVLTYEELSKRVLVCANVLRREYGIKAGDKIVVCAVSSPDYIIALLAGQYLGAVTIPVDKLIKPDALVKLTEYIAPALILARHSGDCSGWKCVGLHEVINAVGIPQISDSPAEVEESAPIEMLFTTGTTGAPKGVMLGVKCINEITHNTIVGVGMRSDDVVLIPLPLNHSVGMRVLRSVLSLGATVVLQDGFAFANEVEVNILKYGCTSLVCVPASLELLRRQMYDRFVRVMGRLRYIEVGAGSLSIPMKGKLVKELPNTTIINTWGSSETGGAIFLNASKNQDKHGSLGKPVDSVEFAVVGEDGSFGSAHDASSAGRMALKGGMRMLGYYNLPNETNDVLRGDWLLTNDLAYSDNDGFVYMLGRRDDIINVGGEKVAPVEVENIASNFDGVRECACIGVPDAITGQAVALYYATDDSNFNEAELKTYLAKTAARYQVPKHYVRIDSLPRNRMSKLDRKAIKTLWNQAQEDRRASQSVINAILTRKSIRDFTKEAIRREQLESIVKCGIQAPCAHNMQTWRFTVIRNVAVIDRFKDVLTRKAKQYKAVCYGFNNPTAAILVTNDRRNRNAAQDCACAAENMMLAAHAMGLGSVWNNTISYMQDDEEVRKVLDYINVPSKNVPWLLLLLGHPAADDNQSPQRRTDIVAWID